MLAAMPVLRAAIFNLKEPLQSTMELKQEPENPLVNADIPQHGQGLANVHMVKGLADIVDEGGTRPIGCLSLREPQPGMDPVGASARNAALYWMGHPSVGSAAKPARNN